MTGEEIRHRKQHHPSSDRPRSKHHQLHQYLRLNQKQHLHHQQPLLSKKNNHNHIHTHSNHTVVMSSSSVEAPSMRLTLFIGATYILSGVMQPILMAIAENAGIADSKCQLYMLPYYLGPFMVSLTLCWPQRRTTLTDKDGTKPLPPTPIQFPSRRTVVKAAFISLFDLTAQSMNYSGAAMAGPTIFAIIYSSVSVWTAFLSRVFLDRYMTWKQWTGVMVVFLGLVITAFDSISLGPKVFHGSLLVFFGSMMHAFFYVMSEGILTQKQSSSDGDKEDEESEEPLSVVMNTSIQTGVAMSTNLVWQLSYTRTHFHELIWVPMQKQHTTPLMAIMILVAIGLTNLVHCTSFFSTLKHFPGGAVSAGVGKGLQAVMVFLATSVLICGRFGGQEMCFSTAKLASLFTVCAGVLLFAKATEQVHNDEMTSSNGTNGTLSMKKLGGSNHAGYKSIPNGEDV